MLNKTTVLFPSVLLPLLSAFLRHGRPTHLTSDVVGSCCDDLAHTLTFAPAVQNLWTRDERKPKKLGGGYVKWRVSIEKGGWFKWPLAAVICVLPCSCELNNGAETSQYTWGEVVGHQVVGCQGSSTGLVINETGRCTTGSSAARATLVVTTNTPNTAW